MMKKISIILSGLFLFVSYSFSFGSTFKRKRLIKDYLDLLEGKFYFSANWYGYHLGYKEFEGDSTLDEDTGWLKGYNIKLGYISNKYLGEILCRPFIELYFRKFEGEVTYKGSTWGGTPLEFKQKSKIYRYGAKLGGYKDLYRNLSVKGYLSAGERIWYRGENRVINGAIEYKEKYWWVYFGGGGGLEFKASENLLLGLDFEIMSAPSSLRKMHAQLGSGVTFTLGSIWGCELTFPFRYYLSKTFSLDFTPYYIYWKVDASDTQTVILSGIPVLVYEPESKSEIYGVSIGLTFNF